MASEEIRPKNCEISVLFVPFDQTVIHVERRAKGLTDVNSSGIRSTVLDLFGCMDVQSSAVQKDESQIIVPRNPTQLEPCMTYILNRIFEEKKRHPDIIFLSEITQAIIQPKKQKWKDMDYVKITDNGSIFSIPDCNKMAVYRLESSSIEIIPKSFTKHVINLEIENAVISGVHVPNESAKNKKEVANWLAENLANSNFIFGDFNIGFSNEKYVANSKIEIRRGDDSVHFSPFNSNLLIGANKSGERAIFQFSNSAGNRHLMGACIDNTCKVAMRSTLELIPEYYDDNGTNIVFSDHPSLFTYLELNPLLWQKGQVSEESRKKMARITIGESRES